MKAQVCTYYMASAILIIADASSTRPSRCESEAKQARKKQCGLGCASSDGKSAQAQKTRSDSVAEAAQAHKKRRTSSGASPHTADVNSARSQKLEVSRPSFYSEMFLDILFDDD